jgi:hypothetical protein
MPEPRSWVDDKDRYQALARQTCSQARLAVKSGPFWQAVAWALWLASAGRLSRRRFMTEFASTLGPVQAYPPAWKQLSPALVVHEARHTWQFARAGWLVPVAGWLGSRCRVWAGLLPMALAYGCFPLPVFFCYGRMRLELDAESHAWSVALRRQWTDPDRVRRRAESFAETVSSWAYLRSWPASWTRTAYLRRAEQVIADWRQEQSTRPDVS